MREFLKYFLYIFFRFKNWSIETKRKKKKNQNLSKYPNQNFKKVTEKVPKYHLIWWKKLHLLIAFKSTSWVFLTQSQWRLWVYGNGSPDFKGILLVLAHICWGFLCHVGGKHSLFQVTVARDYPLQFPMILQVPETCLGYSKWNFHSYVIQTFICLSTCTWIYRLICNRFFFFLWVDNKLQCYQLYWIVH